MHSNACVTSRVSATRSSYFLSCVHVVIMRAYSSPEVLRELRFYWRGALLRASFFGKDRRAFSGHFAACHTHTHACKADVMEEARLLGVERLTKASRFGTVFFWLIYKWRNGSASIVCASEPVTA